MSPAKYQIANYDCLWEKTTHWKPTLSQQKLFQQIYQEILAVNQSLNLTRITSRDDFWEKHLWDSLAPILSFNLTNLKVIDIGTGAGFPGIPTAIAFPNSQVTLLDATRKKIDFLDSLINKLTLTNVTTLIGRAEAIGQNKVYREKFDLALIRAVSKPSVCAEYALPLLKEHGLALLYRGQWTREDTEKLLEPVNQLGGKINKIVQFITPLNHIIHNCIYIEKIKKTPLVFPRAIGKPLKNPL
jgi:16S rRNA (guanine527-N7)-methyltransferase